MEYSIEPLRLEDEDAFRLHLNGPKAYGVIWDMLQYLRGKWKYTDPENEAWWEAYQKLYDIMRECGMNFEEEYI